MDSRRASFASSLILGTIQLYKNVRPYYYRAVDDPRDRDYARLLVETCIGVQPGWQVVVYGDVLGRPLIEEVLRAIAEGGAYGVLRLSFGVSNFANAAWIRHAPKELLDSVAPLELSALEQADGVIVVQAPENTRDAAAIESWRLQ